MSRRTIQILIVGAVLLVAAFVLAACSPAATVASPTSVPTQAPAACPTAAACVLPTPAPTQPAVEVPNQKLWAASGHADTKAEAFNHWNTPVAPATEGVVPADCARCHTSTGYQEYVATGKVAADQPIGTTVDCNACHNDATLALTSVTFPSGVVIDNLGPEARCMECHQGRASMKTVDDTIAKFKVTDDDTPATPITNADGTTTAMSFVNAHYFTAALTLYGTEVKGGYEYAGQTYDPKLQHVPEMDNCIACHNQHSLAVQVDKCAECHTGVATVDDLKNIRMVSSSMDYNGNGNITEGISAEVSGLQDTLLKAIYSYAKDVAGMGVVYDPATYPYFLQDKGSTGKADLNDKGAVIAYANWTARMLKAAYNYQLIAKDPGAFAHNPKYAIELLYDSIADLNTKLTTKIDMSKMARTDSAHFAGSTMPFRDWDTTGTVPFDCAKCHSATGLPQFIANGGTLLISKTGALSITGISSQPVANGYLCSTCHDTSNMPALIAVVKVPFPNGATLTFSTKTDDKGALIPVNSNICLECHQGRLSTVTMNAYLTAYPTLDKVDAKITFKNVHYLAAGATLFGTAAKGAYEYDGKKYNGENMHTSGMTTCTDCHDQHSLQVKTDKCAACHPEAATNVESIRKSTVSYDGSTDAAEPMSDVVKAFETRLYAAIQKYATGTSKLGIVYDGATYPYFMVDKDGDGKADLDANGAPISYNAWTARLLKAAYNYQFAIKDPGAYAHNPKYILQVLYDSIQDLGGDVTGLVRPDVTVPAS